MHFNCERMRSVAIGHDNNGDFVHKKIDLHDLSKDWNPTNFSLGNIARLHDNIHTSQPWQLKKEQRGVCTLLDPDQHDWWITYKCDTLRLVTTETYLKHVRLW